MAAKIALMRNINNKQVKLNTPAQIDSHSEQALIPLRLISESMDTFICWKAIGRQLEINIVDADPSNFSLFPKTVLPQQKTVGTL